MDPIALVGLLVLYLAAAALVGWLVFFPAQRRRAAGSVGRFAQRVAGPLHGFGGRLAARFAGSGAWVESGARRSMAWAARHRMALAGAALIVLAPALMALALRSRQGLEGYAELAPAENAVVSSLLFGEQLVPPPPLPPEVFVTEEVELVRPALGTASRDWDQLDAEFRQRLLQVFRIMEGHGYRMALLEGYRSPERQTMLASLGPSVTNAGAYQSYHQFGLAADSAFFKDGKLVISERDPWAMRGYELYGEAAESVGLSWGGRWKMMDFGHVELRRPGVIGRRG